MTTAIRLSFTLFGIAGLVCISGCGGCSCQRNQKTAEELQKELDDRAKEKEKQKKPPFEVQNVLALPTELQSGPFWCKPGHWTEAVLLARSNEADFDGELELSVLGPGNRALRLEAMPYGLTSVRPAVLPKEQARAIEGPMFVPPSAASSGSQVSARIVQRRSGRPAIESTQSLGSRMSAHQYHFVVLARFQTSYGYLRDMVCFRNPLDLDTTSGEKTYYRVTLLNGEKPMLLPSSALTWTSIAHVLWDAADPTQLRPEQQTAIVDWLHWGGQIIISGPDSLDRLKHSFLEPFLPAAQAGERKIGTDDLKTLSEHWAPLREREKGYARLVPSQPWSGVKFEKHADARFVPGTAELVAERRVGRGRIVVTAFPLTARELIAWKNFDSFFNACLLGRPPRVFDFNEARIPPCKVAWTGDAGHAIDPRNVCKLRYFTRDIERPTPTAEEQPLPTAPSRNAIALRNFYAGAAPSDEEPVPVFPDVAGWNDFNAVAQVARSSMRSAAEIEVPQPSFVLWVLGGYLLVLVPINWAFFRLLRRVEWAWAAAPVIAVACTAIMIRLARLDIGFARSATEIDVVEIQGDYPRAHVTRYSALYSSLYTRYNIGSEDPGAQVLPFPVVNKPEDFRLSIGQLLTPLRHRSVTESSLQNFSVSSNATNFLHGEQMAELGGGLVLTQNRRGEFQLHNATNFDLRGVGVLRRGADRDGPADKSLSELGSEGAWIDSLPAGATVLPKFASDWRETWSREREHSPATGPTAQGEFSLREVVAVAERLDHFEPGEIRLIGWTEGEIPGQAITPAAPQTRRATLVVAHLRYPRPPDPKPDVNSPILSKNTLGDSDTR